MSSVNVLPPGTNELSGQRPPANRSRLVIPKGERPIPTSVRLTDTRTALTRGLAEYIESIVVEQVDGRQLRFGRVLYNWAEPEEKSVYPSAVVLSKGDGLYDSSGFTPGVNSKCRLPQPDGRYIVTPAELTVPISVEIWANDPVERSTLCSALEDAFTPFQTHYGFTLQLPHYFNSTANYELKSMTYLDSETDAIQRVRRAMFTLDGRVSVVRLFEFPDARPSARVVAVGPNVIVDVT